MNDFKNKNTSHEMNEHDKLQHIDKLKRLTK